MEAADTPPGPLSHPGLPLPQLLGPGCDDSQLLPCLELDPWKVISPTPSRSVCSQRPTSLGKVAPCLPVGQHCVQCRLQSALWCQAGSESGWGPSLAYLLPLPYPASSHLFSLECSLNILHALNRCLRLCKEAT